MFSEHFQFPAFGSARQVQSDVAPECAADLVEHEVTDVGCHHYHTKLSELLCTRPGTVLEKLKLHMHMKVATLPIWTPMLFHDQSLH